MSRQIFFIICVALIFLGGVLRLYKLDQYPSVLNRDEAALAINALFIHDTGQDEWGNRLPLQFKSFGDYKLPGYIYLLSTFFFVGANDYIVRLPSAIAGIFLLIATIFWIKQLLPHQQGKSFFLFLLLTLSISPFALFYSRMAWEANVALCLFISSLALLHHHQPTLKKDLLAMFLLFLAILTYNTPLLLMPFILFSLILKRDMRSPKKWLTPVISLSVIFCLSLFFLSANNTQKSGIIFFNDGTVLNEYPIYRANLPRFLQPVLGSKLAYFSTIAFDHYSQTFLPSFLLIKGGQHPWHTIPEKGHLLWVTYILFCIGSLSQLINTLQFLSKKRLSDITPLLLLIISPFPAIFTTDAPHATRSLFTFIMIIVFSGIGLQTILQQTKKFHRNARLSVVIILSLLTVLEGSYYLKSYFIDWPSNFSKDFHISYKQTLSKALERYPEGDIAIIDKGLYLYAVTSWYQKVNAQVFLSTVKRTGPDTVGLYRVTQFDRFYFTEDPKIQLPDKKVTLDQTAEYGTWEIQ